MAVALGISTVPAHSESLSAENSSEPVSTSAQDSVFTTSDRLAWQLAAPLADDARRAGLLAAAARQPVDLARVNASPALADAVGRANRAVSAAKGLPVDQAALLRLRLANPDSLPALRRGAQPLIAASPSDDDAPTVTAYDRTGRTVLLDAATPPEQPVFVVEVDTSKALPLGLEVIRTELAEHGLTGAEPEVAPTAGYWATQVRSVRLNDDKEPWAKGAADIFGIAGGFGLDGKVKIDTVTMPYLDHDGTTYYPNQLIVHFSAYKYNLADFVMMEDDGDTNYRSLAIALADALLTIADGGAYIPLVNAILNAMPDSWWTDDPDYVDSWYTLSTGTSGTFTGAAGNGRMALAPYWVAPL